MDGWGYMEAIIPTQIIHLRDAAVRLLERHGDVCSGTLGHREMGHLELRDALSLLLLYAGADDPRFDRAATRWIGQPVRSWEMSSG
jgi:hypothetical protein